MSRRHIWIMVLCCLIPIAGLAAVYLLNIPASNVILFGLVLLCPLLHVLLMGAMGKEHHAGQTRGHAHASAGKAEPGAE